MVEGKDEWMCDRSGCPLFCHRSFLSEHLLIHLQYYHDEDVGYTTEKDLARCNITPSFWRCSKCLVRNMNMVEWACWSCKAICEDPRIEARIKLREKLAFKDPGTDATPQVSISTRYPYLTYPQYPQHGENSFFDVPRPRIGPQEPQQKLSDPQSQAITDEVSHAGCHYETTTGVDTRPEG
ncbi:hypothetical protein N431DRAFT_88971 [Stipitochalara longipes BDJ]|nr:hypothetical protein N431DRAFT_88971 [Stipitochalara longipes BDJ]